MPRIPIMFMRTPLNAPFLNLERRRGGLSYLWNYVFHRSQPGQKALDSQHMPGSLVVIREAYRTQIKSRFHNGQTARQRNRIKRSIQVVAEVTDFGRPRGKQGFIGINTGISGKCESNVDWFGFIFCGFSLYAIFQDGLCPK